MAVAAPATGVEREAYVPSPYGAVSVSPYSILMSPTGNPSSSAMIWANVVSWPWPCVWTPIRARTLPVGWTRISHESNIFSPRMSKSCDGPAPTISVKLLMPMPMSSPRSRFSACSLRSSS